MTKFSQYQSGHFCWVELCAQNAQQAKAFYTQLFNWQPNDMPLPQGGFYTMLQSQGVDIGALYQMDDTRLKQGVPSHWLSYIATDNIEATVEKAKLLGAEIIMGPMAVGDAGTMALLFEPNGAMFALWQANQHSGSGIKDEANTPCWNELASKNAEQSTRFYCQLLGWESRTEAMGDMMYTLFIQDGKQVAGMLEMTEDWGEMPAHWMVYFQVDDIQGLLERVTQLGGSVCVPASQIDGVGTFSVITDPDGGFFSVLQPNS